MMFSFGVFWCCGFGLVVVIACVLCFVCLLLVVYDWFLWCGGFGCFLV